MICHRCGMEDQRGQILKRVERGGSQECASCLARPTNSVKTDYGICRPHRGELDEFDRPLDHRGKLYREGERMCGNSDCIAKSHIAGSEPEISPEQKALEAERHDISYKTGKKLSWDQLVKAVISEGLRSGKHNNPTTGN